MNPLLFRPPPSPHFQSRVGGEGGGGAGFSLLFHPSPPVLLPSCHTEEKGEEGIPPSQKAPPRNKQPSPPTSAKPLPAVARAAAAAARLGFCFCPYSDRRTEVPPLLPSSQRMMPSGEKESFFGSYAFLSHVPLAPPPAKASAAAAAAAGPQQSSPILPLVVVRTDRGWRRRRRHTSPANRCGSIY